MKSNAVVRAVSSSSISRGMRLLEEVEKSCGRQKALLDEISDLSQLEAGSAPFNRSTVNLHAILSQTITGLPELQDRPVTIDLVADNAITVHGDAVRLKTAFSSILHALRRELVTSDHLVVRVETRARTRAGPLYGLRSANRTGSTHSCNCSRPGSRPSTSGAAAAASASRTRAASSSRTQAALWSATRRRQIERDRHAPERLV